MDKVFERLDARIQKWVHKQGWKDLRDIQEMSVLPILSADTDVVISAPTAAGKTEAAFFPACSAIAEEKQGFGILYISPLKALINDQYRRLESLCDCLDMAVTPWHGDVSQSRKKRAKQCPEGILLITPESLESLLMRESSWAREAFGALRYIIVDEYHAFVGFERGCHLQSLMHRLENLLDRRKEPMPRIALSATLGDMDGIKSYLRPTKSIPCRLIVGNQFQSMLKVQVRGYLEEHAEAVATPGELVDSHLISDEKIARKLYETLRGDSHLVFANSRRRTEKFAVKLKEMCKKNHVPNEFFPHHGSLSKELRHEVESRLQKENLSTTAFCTMTLELGIDIGKVHSVAQVTAPHSVASLRQRLGRSGRRGAPAVLRMYISEKKLTAQSNLVDKLRLELLQSLAMVRLLVEKWYEPADTDLYHFSTLLHQVLAVIAQWGGVRADQLWSVLCSAGSFGEIEVGHFKSLLTHMGDTGLVVQLGSGELVLGEVGERIVSHYSFYSVFKTPEEYQIVVEQKTLGTLPVDSFLMVDQYIVFGGRRWRIKDIDSGKKKIFVTPAEAGDPPSFGGNGSMTVHDRVRQEMYEIYRSGDYRIAVGEARPGFLDQTGESLLQEGLRNFKDANLENDRIVQQGRNVCVVPWMGDKVVNTLAVMLNRHGYRADHYAGIIEIENAEAKEISECLKSAISSPVPSEAELAELVESKETEKYDHLLPESLLNVAYGSKAFDSEKTALWLSEAAGSFT